MTVAVGCKARGYNSSVQGTDDGQVTPSGVRNHPLDKPMSKVLCMQTLQAGLPCDKLDSSQGSFYESACIKVAENSYMAACGIAKHHIDGETLKGGVHLEWHLKMGVYYTIPLLTPAPVSPVPAGSTLEETCASLFSKKGCSEVCAEDSKTRFCRLPGEGVTQCINRCEEVFGKRQPRAEFNR
jgi:hypothetical protein